MTKAYVFADERPGEGTHAEMVQHLAAVLDPLTCQRLAPLLHPGARCLEIGAGAGTIALWMAEQGAAVTATDLEPEHIPEHPGITALRHDITVDPLDGRWDVIHARLVLAHQPSRVDLVTKLAKALTPGGALVVDEFASGAWERCVLDAPDRGEAQWLFDHYHAALAAIMGGAGSDVEWGRNAHRVMAEAGLVDVDTYLGGARSWRGGEAGCMLPYAMTTQMRDQLLAHGMSQEELLRFRRLLKDHRLIILSSAAISTVGRRPSR